MTPAAGRVVAVVVSFNPDAAALTARLDALREQVSATVVVDNASTPPPALPEGARLIPLGENLGGGGAADRR
jgi:GT2 family glycosyltransferase